MSGGPRYLVSAETAAKIQRTFAYHAPKADQTGRYSAIRVMAADFATLIAESCPESREKALAMTNLEQAAMWAAAAIARNEAGS